MKKCNTFTFIGSAALLLLAASCGGGGYSYGGGSSGGGGSGGSGSSSVTITPTSSTIAINATQQFTASSPGTDATYTWKSSDISVATIDSTGLATGIAAGTTNITVTSKYTISGYSYTETSDPVILTVSASGMVMGTAAVGHPLIGALVSIEDSQGLIQYATTDMNGRFAFTVSGLTAPYLLKISDNQDHVMYSIGNTAGVINIDPFTDMIVRSWFQSRGTDAGSVFANPQSHLVANHAALRKLDQALVKALTPSLKTYGMNPAKFSLLHSPFTADGHGLDGLLDHIHFMQQEGRFLISNSDAGGSISLEASRNRIVVRALSPVTQQPDNLQTLAF